MSGNINAFSDFAKMAQSLFFLAFSIKYHIQMIAQTYRFFGPNTPGKNLTFETFPVQYRI